MTQATLEALYHNAQCVRHPDHMGSKGVSSFLGFHFAVHSLHEDTVEFWSHRCGQLSLLLIPYLRRTTRPPLQSRRPQSHRVHLRQGDHSPVQGKSLAPYALERAICLFVWPMSFNSPFPDVH